MKSEEKSNFNPDLFRHRKASLLSVEKYVEGITQGDRTILGRAITLIESERVDHQQLAQQVIERCMPLSGKSIRIGITGSPGVGKSTFVEALGQVVIQDDHRVAVLAIDPTSTISKGSILGDKTRMEQLSNHPRAYIRPSASGQSLGGVARKTRETILLCEAAGYDVILIETVGVGQSEIAVHSMTDLFLLLLLPGAGDELQGIKRGIVEMADILAINKSDGERVHLARQTQLAYQQATHLALAKDSEWVPVVTTCSALEKTGIGEIWESVQNYHQSVQSNGYLPGNRKNQAVFWLKDHIDVYLRNSFYNHPAVARKKEDVEKDVMLGKCSPFQGAKILLDIFEKE